jgi:hypothetical protein
MHHEILKQILTTRRHEEDDKDRKNRMLLSGYSGSSSTTTNQSGKSAPATYATFSGRRSAAVKDSAAKIPKPAPKKDEKPTERMRYMI